MKTVAIKPIVSLTLKSMLMVAFLLPFISCEADEEAPSIEVFAPQQQASFNYNGIIEVEAIFKDDTRLKSYEVKIVNEAGEQPEEFDFKSANSLDVTRFDYSANILIPDSVGPKYFLHFTLTDDLDKSSEAEVELLFSP